MAIKTRRGKLYPAVEKDYALNLGLDEIEWDRIVDRLGRPPNHFECAIFATLWSEAVANKSSESLLQSARQEQPQVISVPGSRLSLIDIGNDYYLSLRLVHNNQQSDVEPFYGAQTAMDQSLEELSSVGAKPLALLTMLRFGNHELVRSQRLFQSAVDGIGAFANRFGTPVVGGELAFHSRYNKSPMINSGVVGLLHNKNSLQNSQLPFGSPVLYVGAPTGRDGLPRKRLEADTLLEKTDLRDRTLKISDPLLASRLIAACAEAVEKNVLTDIVAVGVGGLAVSAFELSRRVGKPILLDMDRIPVRGRDDMKPLEVILSESGERLLVVAQKGQHRALTDIFYKWDIDSLKVGELNDADGIEFYWNHYIAADIPFQFALGGSSQKNIDVVQFPPMLKRVDSSGQADKARKRKRKVDDEWSLVRETALSQDEEHEREFDCPKDLEDVWLDMLANPNLCSRRPMYDLFDQVVGARTVARPGADAAVLRVEERQSQPEQASKGIAVTLDSNSLYVSMEPYLGTVQTVAEGMRNLAASGALPVGIAHCLNFGNPENYRDICDLAEAIRGLGDATKIWGIPVLSENVSLGNGTEGSPTLPTPAILMAGLVSDINKVCGIGFRQRGDRVLLLGRTKNEIGCSEYANYVHKRVNHMVPDIDFDFEKAICRFIVSLIEAELLCSAHDLSAGGLAIALTECCMARERPIGAKLQIEPQVFDTPNGPIPLRRDSALFSETSGRFLISCDPTKEATIRKLCEEAKIPITASGEVGGSTVCLEGVVDVELPISTTYRLWIHRIEHLLGMRSENVDL